MAGVTLVTLVDDPAHVNLPDPTLSAPTSPSTPAKSSSTPSKSIKYCTVFENDSVYVHPFKWQHPVYISIVSRNCVKLCELGIPEEKRIEDKDQNTTTSTNKMTVKELVTSPFLWVVSGCYLAVFCTKTALADWAQIYLMEELGRTQLQGKQ